MFKILVVEDNPLILEGICRMIQWDDCDGVLVGKAQDGEEALQIIAENAVDLVITDIRMPGKDGIYLLQQIQMRYQEIQSIVVSAYNEFNYAKEAIKAGSVNYILKPIDPDELNTAVMTASKRKNSLEISDIMDKDTPAILAVLKTKEDYSLTAVQKVFQHISGLSVEEVHPFLFCFLLSSPVAHTSLLNTRSGIKGKVLWGFAYKMADDNMISMYQRALQAASNDLSYLQRAADESLEDLDDKKISVLAFAGQADKIIQAMYRRAAVVLSEGANFQKLAEVIAHMLLIIRSNDYINYSVLKNLEEDMNRHSTELVFFTVEEILEKAKAAITDYCNESKRIDNGRKTLCEQVANLIRKNLEQDISLDEIAGLFFVSPSYLSRTFKQMEGQTIGQYTLQVRMEQAQYLLDNSDLKIADIAAKVGFTDPNYFTRVYKKYTGLLPSSTNKK